MAVAVYAILLFHVTGSWCRVFESRDGYAPPYFAFPPKQGGDDETCPGGCDVGESSPVTSFGVDESGDDPEPPPHFLGKRLLFLDPGWNVQKHSAGAPTPIDAAKNRFTPWGGKRAFYAPSLLPEHRGDIRGREGEEKRELEELALDGREFRPWGRKRNSRSGEEDN